VVSAPNTTPVAGIRTERRSPEVRRKSLLSPIPAIPLDKIDAFLSKTTVVDADTYKNAPYLLGERDGRTLYGTGDEVLARGNWQSNLVTYDIVRQGREFIDPDTRDVLGVESLLIGTATITSYNGDKAIMKVNSAELEARVAAAELYASLLQRNLDALSRALELVANQPPPKAGPGATEVLPGPVTVQRGGLHVAGGGIVVHDIEGRLAGASKRDGPLFVNGRSGGDLVVGNKTAGSVVATGSVRAGRAAGLPSAVAIRMAGEGLTAGDVVVYEARKKGAAVRRAQPGETPFGVVVERAAVELGDGPNLVAVSGVVAVRVGEAVAAGAWLVAGADGAAQGGSGSGIGRALTEASSGTVEVLLHGS